MTTELATESARGDARPTARSASGATTPVQWTEHPLVDMDGAYRKLSDEEFDFLSPEEATAYVAAREERLRKAASDPLRFGFDLPHWRVIRHFLQQREELFNFGGNDTAKTELLAKLAVEALYRRLELPGAMPGAPQVLCMAQNDTMSKRVQQKRIYSYLPAESRQLNESSTPRKRTATQKLTYSDDGGFTNGSFTIANPRGASVIFRNVTQFERNELSLEGDGFHFCGVDESCPLALLEVLRFRTAKKSGRLGYFFTPVNGWDAVCNNVFTGARIIAYLPMQWDWTARSTGGQYAGAAAPACRQGERVTQHGYEGTLRSDGQFVPRGAEEVAEFLTGGINPEIQFPELDLSKSYAPGCPPGHMPFVMQPLKAEQVIIFSWSHWNPFAPRSKFNRKLPKIADKCVGRGQRVALIRLFGYTEKLQGALIQNFRPDYFPKGHLIRHAELLKILRTTPHNLRHGVDPATARSWFQGWKAVCPNGLDNRPMQYLVWESPNATEGEWVTPDGEIGDGQRAFAGRDVDSWKIYIRETEAMLAAQIAGSQNSEKAERDGGHGVASQREATHLDPPHHAFRQTHQNQDPILRAGDARGFASQTGEGTRYLELFFRDDSAKDPRLSPMVFRPAKVMSTVWQDVHDTGKLIDLFACDWEKPISAENTPHLLVSDACKNFISCVLNWDGKKQTLEGKPVNSPYADGVDMGRVLFDQEIPFVDQTRSAVSGGGAWT